MHRWIAPLLSIFVAATLAGCPATPVATSTADGFSTDTGPTGPGLTVHVSPDLVVLYAVPSGVAAKVVDYVIQDAKTKEIIYHVESANDATNFRLELQRTRLPKGLYHMKIFINKATTPTDEKDIDMP